MKKNLLSLSIAALIGGLGVAGVANAGVAQLGTGAAFPAATAAGFANLTNATALGISPAGIGHILMVPYFTAQNGNATLLSVVNTDTKNGKAVKVRFRGAANSDDLLDFQVFLSPGDVWTANVAKGADGRSVLTTADNSCTQPAIPAAGVAFGTGRLPATFTAEQKAAQTLEGYVEIFNMADVPPTYIDGVSRVYGTVIPGGTGASTTNALFTATKHVAGTAPCTGATLSALQAVNAVTNEASAVAFGLNTPTTGLTGGWAVVNVAGASVAWSGNSSALQATIGASGAAASGRIVFSAQRADAEVAANVNALTNDPLLRVPATGTPKVVAALQDLPDLSTPYTNLTALSATDTLRPLAQATNLTNAIKVTSITNQYANDASISAKTDWVFSMPTRRYSVAANYSAATSADSYPVFNLGVNANGQLAGAAQSAAKVGATPVQDAAEMNYFNGSNVSVDATSGNLCVNSTASKFYDREETVKSGGAFTSPVTSATLRFCGETSVLSFTNDESVLGATVARSVTADGYVNGWANVSLGKPSSANMNVIGGLPVIGSSFIKLTNAGGLANNFSGTYGITWAHRYGN